MKTLFAILLLTISATVFADDEEPQVTVCDVRGIVASHIITTKRMFPVERQFERFVYQLEGRGVGNRRRLAIMREWYKAWGSTAMETWFKVTYGSYDDPKRAQESEVKACTITDNAIPEVTEPKMKSDV